MSAGVERLSGEVAEIGTVVDSAVTLIEGLAQQIRDSLGDEEALGALADELDAKANALASAVAANTPSQEPDDEPVPEPTGDEF